MKKCLNLGCQVHHFDSNGDCEWINQDIVQDDPNIRAEIYSDANHLPLEDNSIDFIYAGHLVEHYYPDTLSSAVREWHRVLRRGGCLVVITPDSGMCFNLYADGRLKMEDLFQQVYGRIYSTDRREETHHMIFDRISLAKEMNIGASWSKTEDLDFRRIPSELEPFMDSEISRGALQLGLVLTK